MARILVTGPNGYLGGHLLTRLHEQGHWVTTLGAREMIRSREWVRTAAGFDSIVHLAWYSKAGPGNDSIHKNCEQATVDLVNHAGLARIIFASTASVVPTPACPYTRGKRAAEEYIMRRAGQHTILRFGSFMGLGSLRTKKELVVNAFAIDGWTKKRIEVRWPGAWKPLIHVRDAADVIVKAVEAPCAWGIQLAAPWCFTAFDIARRTSMITGADIVITEEGAGPRSCLVSTGDLKWRWKTVEEAIYELKDYREQPEDTNTPWQLDKSTSTKIAANLVG